MKLTAILLMAGSLWAQGNHPPVNVNTAIMQDFQRRVDGYLQLRKSAESKLSQLKATPSQAKISQHEGALGQAVRSARKDARQGDVFSPEIAMEIRRLITMAIEAGDRGHIGQSLRHAEPIQLHLKVNDGYPARQPLQSTPPSLLQNLPRLPQDIEYRITGRDLILLDTKANLIVDIISGVFS